MVKNNEFCWREVLCDSSKKRVLYGVSICRQQPELFPSLFGLAMEQSGKYSQRASRIICELLKKPDSIFLEYVGIVLNELETIFDESIKFCFLNIFRECKLPDDDEKLGHLTKICFDAVESKVERIAIKIYAIDILYRISEVVPEMKPEIFYLINKYLEGSPPAFISRGRKILNSLRKEVDIFDEGLY